MDNKTKPLFSRKSLVKIIFPLIIQQLLAVTIGMADSMMVSSAGEEAVSGVSLVTTLDILLICAFSALATGGAIVISQFIGKKDLEKLCQGAEIKNGLSIPGASVYDVKDTVKVWIDE